MPDGSGVPGIQPAIDGSALVAGDPRPLLKLLLRGSAALPAQPARYENAMPGFETLSDDELAALASYLRRTFGGSSQAVTAAQVRALRD
jgi:mono/diheme cytochrome c family protein